MSTRNTPLVSGEIYHIVNRGVASQPIFVNKRSYRRFIQTMVYYQNINVPLRYSYFIRLKEDQKSKIISMLQLMNRFLVEIIAYCLMPNHFHLLLRQIEYKGITKFVGNITNSYSKYFNTISERSGPLFQGRFKSIRIETDEQLLHVNRYIHLNPYSGYVIKAIDDLEKYLYSSLPEYLGSKNNKICNKEVILDHFKNSQSLYKQFVFDQADYQRELQNIKHLLME